MTNERLYYLIFCGTSPQAVVNSIWASVDIKGIIPKKIVLLVNKNQTKIDKIRNCVETLANEIINNECEVELLHVTQTDIKYNIEKIDAFIKKIQANERIIFDITPGRKTMSISGLLYVLRELKRQNKSLQFENLVYWQLLDSGKYIRKWYPEIPRKNFQFVDILEVLG